MARRKDSKAKARQVNASSLQGKARTWHVFFFDVATLKAACFPQQSSVAVEKNIRMRLAIAGALATKHVQTSKVGTGRKQLHWSVQGTALSDQPRKQNKKGWYISCHKSRQ
jgi:hypothetical protein